MNRKLNIVVDPNFFKKYIFSIGENEYKFKLEDDGLHTFMKNEKGESKLFLDWKAKYADFTFYSKRPFAIDLESGDGLEKIDSLDKLYIFVNLGAKCIERIYLLDDNVKAIKVAKKLKYFLDIINFSKFIPRQYVLSSYFSGKINLAPRIYFSYTTISSTIILNINIGEITMFYDWENNKMVFDFNVDNLSCDELINMYLDKCGNGSNDDDGPNGTNGSNDFFYSKKLYNPKDSFSVLSDENGRKKFKFTLYLDKEDKEFNTIMIHYKSIMQYLITETMNRLYDINSSQSKKAIIALRYYISSDKFIDFFVGNVKKKKNEIAFVEEVPYNYNKKVSMMHKGSIIEIDYEKGIIHYSYLKEYPVLINMDNGEGLSAISHGRKIETFFDLITMILNEQSGTNNFLLKTKLTRFINIMTQYKQKLFHQEKNVFMMPNNEMPFMMQNKEIPFIMPNKEMPFIMQNSEVPQFMFPNKEVPYMMPSCENSHEC
jgi:hypothetical protein